MATKCNTYLRKAAAFSYVSMYDLWLRPGIKGLKQKEQRKKSETQRKAESQESFQPVQNSRV